MTSGTKTAPRPDPRRRAWLIVLPAWAAGLPARAAEFDLKTLMARMAQRKSGQARFSEERSVAGLDGPLLSSGTLSFSAPDRFARHTLQPRPESMELDGRLLILRRGGRTRQMELDAVPEVAALLEAMRATLTGDAALLARHFRTQLSGNDAKWVLQLQPLDERLARQVRNVELVGQAGDLRSIELRLANGDRSLMLIDPLGPAAPAGSPTPPGR